MVFETVVAQVLNKVVGKYTHVDQKQLQLSVWRGDVTLKDVRLNAEQVEADINKYSNGKFPVKFQGGFIGNLVVQIPWTNLTTEPIIIIIEDLYAVLSPKNAEDIKFDPEAEKEQKRKDVASLDQQISMESARLTPDESPGFFQALVEKIIDNIQIKINRVHIRYQNDSHNTPEHPSMSLGLTLEHLSVVSADHNFNPKYINTPHNLIFKLASMKNLGIYLNPDDKPVAVASHIDLARELRNLIFTTQSRDPYKQLQYLLHPVSLTMKLTVNKEQIPTKENPIALAELIFDEISTTLTELQYHTITNSLEFLFKIATRASNARYRPNVPIVKNTHAWWLYIFNSLRTHRRGMHMTRQKFDERRKKRLEYMDLYEKKLRDHIGESESRRLGEMELDLSLQDIADFRYRVKEKLRKEGFDWTAVHKQKQPKSWWTWIVGERHQEINYEQELEKLKQVIEYERAKAFVTVEKDIPKFKINVLFKTGNLQLVTSAESLLGRFQFDEFLIKSVVYQEMISVGASVQYIELVDKSSTSTKFPSIVVPMTKSNGQKLFDARIDYRPFDDPGTDFRVKLGALPLQISLNKYWLEAVVSFFHKKTEAPILVASSYQTYMRLQGDYSKQLQNAVKTMKVVKLDIDAQAPTILIPENPYREDTLVAVADLGRFTVQSTKHDLDEVEAKLYNSYRVGLSQLNFTTKILHYQNLISSNTIIENFNINIEMDVLSSSRESLRLPVVKLSGELPRLHLIASLERILELERILYALIGEESPKLSSPHPPKKKRGHPDYEKESEQLWRDPEEVFFLGSFNVSNFTLTIQLHNSDVVDLDLHDFRSTILKRSYDFKVSVSLRDLRITDKIQTEGSQFPLLAETFGSEKENLAFVKLELVYVQDDSPRFANVSTIFNVDIGGLVLYFHRKTIALLVQMSEELTKNSRFYNEPIKPQRKLQSQPTPKGKAPKREPKVVDYLKACGSFRSLEVILIKDQKKFAHFFLGGLETCVALRSDATLCTSGTLGKIVVLDSRESSKFPNIIAIPHGESMVEWKGENFSQGSPNARDYDLSVGIQVNSICLTLAIEFFNQLKVYFNEMAETRRLIGVTANLASGTAQEAYSTMKKNQTRLKYEVLVKNPQILVPDMKTDRFLLADFGDIYLFNTFQQGIPVSEIISISASHMNCQMVRGDQRILGNLQVVAKLVPNTDLLIEATRKMGVNGRTDTEIGIEIQSLIGSISHDHFNLIINLLNQYLFNSPGSPPPTAAPPPPHDPTAGDIKISFTSKKLALELKSTIDEKCLPLNVLVLGEFLDVKIFLPPNEQMFFEVHLDAGKILDQSGNVIVQTILELQNLSVQYFQETSHLMRVLVLSPVAKAAVVPDVVMGLSDFLLPGIFRLGEGPAFLPNTVEVSFEVSTASLFLFEMARNRDTSNMEMTLGILGHLKFITNDLLEITATTKDMQVISRSSANEFWKFMDPTDFTIRYKSQNGKDSLETSMSRVSISLTNQDQRILTNVINGLFEQEKNMKNYIFPPSPEKTSSVNTYHINIGFQEFIVTFVNTCPEVPPLLQLELMGTQVIGTYPGELFANLKMNGHYFNFGKANWEPMLEDWEYKLRLIWNHSGDLTARLECEKFANVNLTVALYRAMNMWMSDVSAKCRTEYAALTIRNLTSMPVQYKVTDSKNVATVNPLERQAVERKDKESIQWFRRNTMTIQIGDNIISDLSLLNRTLTVHPLHDSTTLVVEIIFEDGARTVVLRSLIRIRNTTGYPFEFKVTNRFKHNSFSFFALAGEDASVPPEFTRNSVLTMRPNLNTEWSEEIDLETLDEFKEKTVTIPESRTAKKMHFSVNADTREGLTASLFTIYIASPVMCENLLPCALQVKIHDEVVSVESGSHLAVHSIPREESLEISFRIPEDFTWCGPIDIKEEIKGMTNNSARTFGAPMFDNDGRPLWIYFETKIIDHQILVGIYCKYWIYNRTGFNILLYNEKKQLGPGQNPVLPPRDLSHYDPAWYDPARAENVKPILMSQNPKGKAKKAFIQMENSPIHKQEVDFDAIHSGQIEIKAGNQVFYLGVSVELAPGKFKRSRIITLAPRYLIVNQLQRPVFLKQVGTDVVYKIREDEVLPMHWQPKLKKVATLTFDHGNWEWSGPIPFEELGQKHVNVSDDQNKLQYYLHCDLEFDTKQCSILATLQPTKKEEIPFRIENSTKFHIILWQETQHRKYSLPPAQSQNYTWDDMTSIQKLIVNFGSDTDYRINLNKFQSKHWDDVGVIGEISVSGQTRVLRFRSRDGVPIDELEPYAPCTTLELQLKGLGVSLIDDHPRELLYLSAHKAFIQYSTSSKQSTFEAKLGHLQIDNQLYDTPFDVMMYPVPPKKDSDFLHLSLVASKIFQSVDYYTYFGALMQECNIFLDSRTINYILKVYEILTAKKEDSELHQSYSNIKSPRLTKMVYFEMFHVNPIHVNVSYVHIPSTDPHQPLNEWIGPIVSTIPSIDQAPIRLNALMIEKPYCTREELVTKVTNHYYNQLIRASYRIIGSVELLGNPVSIVSSFGSGVKDFFYEPVHGIVKGPEEFGMGLYKGSTSLVLKPLKSAFKSASSITGTISKGVAFFSLDPEFRAEHHRKQFVKPLNAPQGFAEGARELGEGVVSGITGVVTQPMKGAKEGGTKGLIKGIGIGIVGTVVRPTTGALDMATRTMQGISQSVGPKPVDRFRLPRHFNRERVLEPFNEKKAYAQFLLFKCSGVQYSSDICLFYALYDKHVYVVTDRRVIHATHSLNTYHFKWQVPYEDIALIKSEFARIIIRCGNFKELQKSHKCQFLQMNCNCEIPSEFLYPEQYIIEIEPDTCEHLAKAIFSNWSLFHRLKANTFISNHTPPTPLTQK